MSYPDEDRWAFDDDERCVRSKDGYFFNEKECGEYKNLKDEHLKSLTDEQLGSEAWHYGSTPNQRTKWCAPHEGGEHKSFAECEKSRLFNNLNIALAQLGGEGRSVLGKFLVTKQTKAERDVQTDSVTLVDAATQVLKKVKVVTFAHNLTQVIDDLVSESESSSHEMDELRSERDDSRAREEKAKKDMTDLLSTLRPTLENVLTEYEISTRVYERSRRRAKRESERNRSRLRVDTLMLSSFDRAVEREAKKRCGEVLEALKECQEEAKKRKERSLEALRAVQLSVLTAIFYFLTYVKTVGDVRMRSVLSRLLPVGYDVYYLEENAPKYHGTRTD